MENMAVKVIIGDKGKAWRLEVDAESVSGKSLGEKFDGKDINPDLEGYELEITGGSDASGFPHYSKVEGIGLRKVLLTKGWGMHKRPKGVKKKVPQPNGLRLRKTVRGKILSEKTAQLNLKVIKAGKKKLEEIFADQNKAPEPEKPVENTESPTQETKQEVAPAQ